MASTRDFESLDWDDQQLAEIFHHRGGPFTCVGVTLKGRRCRNPIARHNIARARVELRDLRACSPDLSIVDLRRALKELAERTLCVRNHQYQAADISREWCDVILAGLSGPGQKTASGTSTTEDNATEAPESRSKSTRSTAGDTSGLDDLWEEIRYQQYRKSSRSLPRTSQSIDTRSSSTNRESRGYPQATSNSWSIPSSATNHASSSSSRSSDSKTPRGSTPDVEAEMKRQEAELRANQKRKEAKQQAEKEYQKEKHRQEEKRREEEERRREALRQAKLERAKQEAEAQQRAEREEAARQQRENRLREQAKRQRNEWDASWTRYQSDWVQLSSNHGSSATGDSRDSFPWPVKSGKWKDVTDQGVEIFFRKAPGDEVSENPPKFRSMLRQQALRWHEDKMRHLLVRLAMDGEMKQLAELVTRVIIRLRSGS